MRQTRPTTPKSSTPLQEGDWLSCRFDWNFTVPLGTSSNAGEDGTASMIPGMI